jgi:XTP/dITP diphosphohydrolase
LPTDSKHSLLQGKMVFFATGNIHKFNEARVVLAQNGIAAGMLREKAVEIQSDSLREIASASAMEVCRRCHLPVIVEDAGLFVEALKGFPGPYAAYVYKTLCNKGLLKQMETLSNRRAKFQSAIAYCSPEHPEAICFEGEVQGEITTQERKGKHAESFGFDPIFKPDGSPKTFAEMPIGEKNQFSHRATAIRRFADWYKAQAKSVP